MITCIDDWRKEGEQRLGTLSGHDARKSRRGVSSVAFGPKNTLL